MTPGRDYWKYSSGTLPCNHVYATHLNVRHPQILSTGAPCSNGLQCFDLKMGNQHCSTSNYHKGNMRRTFWLCVHVYYITGRGVCLVMTYSLHDHICSEFGYALFYFVLFIWPFPSRFIRIAFILSSYFKGIWVNIWLPHCQTTNTMDMVKTTGTNAQGPLSLTRVYFNVSIHK